MDASLFAFAVDVVRLTAEPGPLLVAVVLAFLIRSKLHGVLIVANLWLFMELATTMLEPGYGLPACCTSGWWRAPSRSRSPTAR
jgi:hypothetical protein